MLWRTPTAVHILLRPGVHFKPIKCNALLTDWNLRQTRPNFAVESVLVHAQVAGSITQTDESREKNGHVLASQIHRSNLLPDMAQFLANGQADTLICLLLRLSQLVFGRPARMRRWPACEFQVTLLGIGMAQAMHFR
mgnify:CR=1 FL=1